MAKANGNLNVAIPTFIPLADAARKYNISENVLTSLIQDGRIDAAQLPSGELLVSDESLNGKTKEQIIQEEFAHLIGRPITISEAAEKYGLAGTTLRESVNREYIQIIGTGYPMKVNEAEVAYCAVVYRDRAKSGFSTRIFDESGEPYQLKHPDLAEYRRRKRRDEQTE
jgi:hypothetical protein